MAKFDIGRYCLCDEKNTDEILITKITPTYITLHIKTHHGFLYSLDDVKLRRKIFTDEYGYEYIKPIYFVWNTIFTPTAQEKDSDSGFDVLYLQAEHLFKK